MAVLYAPENMKSLISNMSVEKKGVGEGGVPCVGPMKCRIETPSDVAWPNG